MIKWIYGSVYLMVEIYNVKNVEICDIEFFDF